MNVTMKRFDVVICLAAAVLAGCGGDDERKDTGLIRFADPEVKSLCVGNWDADGDGELSYDEAAAVTSLGAVFTGNTEISGFDELEYFTALDSIDDEAFRGCGNLAGVRIPRGVKSIGAYAFCDDSSLKSIVIPDGVERIGSLAFQNCAGLSSLVIPDSVRELGDNPVAYCGNISVFEGKYASADGRCLIADGRLVSYAPSGAAEYSVPAEVVAVGRYAFKHCDELKSVTLHDDVVEIRYQAFEGCSNLESVVIGSGVVSVEANAFCRCGNLTSVYCKPATPPSGAVYMLDGIAPAARIYVPEESVDAYKSAEFWRDHADKIEGYGF